MIKALKNIYPKAISQFIGFVQSAVIRIKRKSAIVQTEEDVLVVKTRLLYRASMIWLLRIQSWQLNGIPPGTEIWNRRMFPMVWQPVYGGYVRKVIRIRQQFYIVVPAQIVQNVIPEGRHLLQNRLFFITWRRFFLMPLADTKKYSIRVWNWIFIFRLSGLQ